MKKTMQRQGEPLEKSAASRSEPLAQEQAAFVDNRNASLVQRKLAQMMGSSSRTVAQRKQMAVIEGKTAQRQEAEEELLQGKFDPIQKAGAPEEELLQGKFDPIQKAGAPEEELLQGKFDPVQKAGAPEEELLQGKFDPVQKAGAPEEELLQGKFDPIQKAEAPEEELLPGKFEPVQLAIAPDEEQLQGKFANDAMAAQRKTDAAPKANNTGLPDNLKAGIENLSGMAMDDVKVHYNSDKPAQLQALAYAQGSDIHVGPGQEKHVPHEAWHVVQQRQGRVQPTVQAKGVAVNDDKALEQEADVMGAQALQQKNVGSHPQTQSEAGRSSTATQSSAVQCKTVDVVGGQFDDGLIGAGYRSYNEREDDVRGNFLKVGAQIELAFIPRPELEAQQVSLVQTTNSTVHNLTSPHVPDQRESLLDDRRTADGSAIDQQIFLNKAPAAQRWESALLLAQFQAMNGLGTVASTNVLLADLLDYFQNGAGSANGPVPLMVAKSPSSIKAKLNKALLDEAGNVAPQVQQGIVEVQRLLAAQAKNVNLDPRYSEERPTVADPLKAPRAAGHERGSGGWTAVKQNGVWNSNAALRDQPGHKIGLADQVVGGEHFETAAMADGNEFLGSVRWGFQIVNGRAVLDPAEIELVNYGSASSEFFAAADAWNAMPVADPVSGQVRATLPLPTLASIKNLKANRRVTMWLQAVTKRYQNAQQFHFDTLTNANFGEFLLTGKIAAWEDGAPDEQAPENQAVLNRTLNDLLKTYPQGEQYLADISHAQLGEYLVTGEIAAWEI